MAYEILGSKWFTNSRACVGIVAVRTGLHDPDKGEWKAYIGNGVGYNQQEDEQHVAAWGNGLSPEEAKGFFPWLTIENYKDS